MRVRVHYRSSGAIVLFLSLYDWINFRKPVLSAAITDGKANIMHCFFFQITVSLWGLVSLCTSRFALLFDDYIYLLLYLLFWLYLILPILEVTLIFFCVFSFSMFLFIFFLSTFW